MTSRWKAVVAMIFAFLLGTIASICLAGDSPRLPCSSSDSRNDAASSTVVPDRDLAGTT